MKKRSRTIDAKSVLGDIKAGMPDAALMEKYRLSALGLESLLRHLDELGMIRRIRATEVVRDLEEGMRDSQLMEKYKLSEEAFKTVLEQLEEATFLNQAVDGRERSSGNVISGREIIKDLSSGMTRWELMLKYKLSGAQLKKAVEMVRAERRRVTEKLGADVRSGMTRSEIMQKYQLSNAELQNVCRKLLTEGSLGPADIQGLKLPLDDGSSVYKERRGISRRSPSLEIVVCDGGNDGARGTIKDITEKGLAVRGIEAEIGERKILWILGDDLGIVDPFELEAECRWQASDASQGQSVAGFQVIRISGADLQKLQEFIELLDLGN